MTQHACPLCGWEKAFLFWMDDAPPTGCPQDSFLAAFKVHSAADCPRIQLDAERRRLVPECFDADGKLLPGQFMVMHEKWCERVPSDPQAVARLRREQARQRREEAAMGEAHVPWVVHEGKTE